LGRWVTDPKIGNALAVLFWLIAGLLALRYMHRVYVDHVSTTPASDHGWFAVDLRDALWQPIRDLFRGHNPYDAPAYVARYPGAGEFDVYAPGWLLVAAPIAALPWKAAVVAWSCVTQIMVVILAIFTCRVARLPKLPWVLPIVLVIILRAYPEYIAQLGGNPSALVAPFAAIALWRARDDWATAVLLAIAMFKPQFGIPVAAALLAAGRWRGVVRSLSITVVASIAPLAIAVHNAGGVSDFVASIGRNLDYASTSPETGVVGASLRRVDAAALLGHARNAYVPWLPTLLLACAFIGVACWAYRGYSTQTWAARVRRYAIASGGVIFALPHGRYDLVFVIPAIAALLHLAVRPEARAADRIAAIVAVIGMGTPTLLPTRLLRHIRLEPGTVNVATTALALLVVVGCLLISRGARREPPAV